MDTDIDPYIDTDMELHLTYATLNIGLVGGLKNKATLKVRVKRVYLRQEWGIDHANNESFYQSGRGRYPSYSSC